MTSRQIPFSAAEELPSVGPEWLHKNIQDKLLPYSEKGIRRLISFPPGPEPRRKGTVAIATLSVNTEEATGSGL